jgi:hypothetical protein
MKNATQVKRFNAAIIDKKGDTKMKRIQQLSLSLIGAALGLAVLSTPAHAVNPQSLDITVSISATKSLSVNATFYDFGAQTVSASTVSVSAIQVTNDSGALVETYTLQGANAASTGGGTTWTLAGSVGSDQYTLAAQFSTAQPVNADGSWSSDDLTTSAITATDLVLGNGTLAQAGASVLPTATRNLWFRMKTPSSVSDTTQRKATLTLGVL